MELGNKQLVKDVGTLTETVNQLGEAVNVIGRALGLVENTEVGSNPDVEVAEGQPEIASAKKQIIQMMAANPRGGFLVINDGMGGHERIDTFSLRLSQIMDAGNANKPYMPVVKTKARRGGF